MTKYETGERRLVLGPEAATLDRLASFAPRRHWAPGKDDPGSKSGLVRALIRMADAIANDDPHNLTAVVNEFRPDDRRGIKED